jgi:molecular chaperone DnaJ
MSKDYYQTLGISKNSTASEIKKAYHKLAKKEHPDQNGGSEESKQKFQEISQAYETLKNPNKKAEYDRFGHDAFTQSGGSGGNGFGGNSAGFGDMGDIFNDIFSDFMGDGRGRRGAKKSRSVRGSDLKYELNIRLEDAFFGAEKTIDFSAASECSSCSGEGGTGVSACNRCNGSGTITTQRGFFAMQQACGTCAGSGVKIQNTCSICSGAGRILSKRKLNVTIPAGIKSGNKLRMVGEGEAGAMGGSTGDLYVVVNIKEHSMFKIKDIDLEMDIPIKLTKAITGDEITIPTIDGSNILLKIPEGVQPNVKIKIKNKGMSKIRSSIRGDLYAKIIIKIPKNLNNEQKELVEKLNHALKEENYKEDEGIFSKFKKYWS